MRDSKDNLILVLTIFSTCCILYFNSLYGIFIFDDQHSIVNNLYIKSFRYIPQLFTGRYTSEPEIPLGMFRPLLLLTFSFNYFFTGLNPMGYHILNILIHFVNGVLLYYLLRLLKPSLPFFWALICSLIFISHPLNSEAVAYITSRSDLLTFLFIFLGIICFLKERWYLALLIYALGLLSKETSLVFPILLIAFTFIYYQNTQTDNAKRRKILYFFISIIGISIIYWLYRYLAIHYLNNAEIIYIGKPIREPWPNILTQIGVALFYLKMFLWPDPLAVHHNFPILESLTHPLALFSTLCLIVFITLIFILRKKQPLISLGIAWYLICLLPKFYGALNVVAAEHHFYLPSFGIYLITAVLLEKPYLKFKRKFLIISFGIISLFTILVWFRNYEYKDALTFWKRSFKVDPTSAIAQYNMGVLYTTMNLLPEAEEAFKTSWKLAPQNAKQLLKDVRENLANIYRLQKKYNDALIKINENIQTGFGDFGTYQSLGVIYLDMKDEAKAEESWKKGLSLNPKARGILYNLGMLYLKKNEFPKAKEFLQRALIEDPDLYATHYCLGRVLEEEKNIDAAIKAYQKSIELQPKFVDAHHRLGMLYTTKSDPRALKELKETLRLSPNMPEAHMFLGIVYAAMNPPQLELAREHTQKAISLGFKPKDEFLKIINYQENQEENIRINK